MRIDEARPQAKLSESGFSGFTKFPRITSVILKIFVILRILILTKGATKPVQKIYQ